MTNKSDSGAQKSLGYSIQSQHPEINNEIEGAINTLKKLQKITTTPVPLDGAKNYADGATNNATIEHSSSEEMDDAGAKALGTPGAVPVLAAGESFGRYQITRLLGRGGMGAVYLSYDSQLQRYVALKTPFLGDNAQAIQRFYREARASAQLRSPYICPIYDVGQLSGIYFISMAFIEGRSLAQLMTEGRVKDSKAIADIVKKVALGLQKAHEQKIIHRDLKPDNIMIDPDGEPIVMDFGLARRVDDDLHITMAGRILGTPAYMSPEQVEGVAQNIGPSTDIYSLGIILYQMISGRLPFQGSLTSVLRQIGNDQPPKPSAIATDRDVDATLERICLKMISKSQTQRYATMTEVAAALGGSEPDRMQVAKMPLFTRIAIWWKVVFGPRAAKEVAPKSAAAISPKSDSATSNGTLFLKDGDPLSGSQTVQVADLSKQEVHSDSQLTEGTIAISPELTPAESQTVDLSVLKEDHDQ